MTIDHGSVEPVDAGEPTAQHDDLENWLHGIRTDLTDNPPDWLRTDSVEAPLDATTSPAVDNDDTGPPLDATTSPAVDNDDTGPPLDATTSPAVDTGPQPRVEQTIGRHRAEE
jgi:hypothetical protein